MNEDTKEVLQLFLDKADELTEMSFFNYLKEGKFGVTFSANESEEGSIEIHGPSQEATKAFLTNIRLFIQDEPISLKSLSKLVE